MKGTVFSDKELAEWSGMKHAGQARDYWENNPVARCIGTHVAIGALSGEALEMRRILRDFIARHDETTTDPLVLRAVELLGCNLEPSQPMFPRWPTQSNTEPPDAVP